jgi:hypothetical protein
MTFPEIPENLDALSAAELRALAADIRKAGLAAVSDPNVDQETLDLCEQAKEMRDTILALAVRKERGAALGDVFGDESEDEPGPPSDVIKSPDPNEDGTYPTDDDDDDEDAEDAEGEAGAEAAPVEGEETQASHRGKVRTATGSGAKRQQVARPRLDQLVAVEGAGRGLHGGDTFESWLQLAECVLEKANSIDPGSPQKFQVGRVVGSFPENRRLTTDMVWNLQMFEEELTAAMCAPAQPVYDLGCDNTANRPVRNSLPAFQPDARGAVTIYPSPSLSDIASGTGVGIWTSTNDANPGATKNPCATIACATPTEYRLYGIYRCITIKNLLQMTFPELVEAYLNRLAAAWARLAEVTLLNAMGTAVTTVTAPHVGYGGSISLPRAILQYLNAYQELQRWEAPDMEMWAHRGLLWALKADIMSRRRTDGGIQRIPSDAEVNSIFTNAGVTPHWFLDVPTWITPLQNFSNAGVIRDFPRNAEFLLARRGKFAVMDRGELNIGVTGNGMYRDNTSNSRNEFTFFFENFEGLVNTDSCPAHIISMPNVCWNGQQIRDILIDCEGDDVTGEDSGQP